MSEEELRAIAKAKFDETVDSMIKFANSIINESTYVYSINEMELALDLKLATLTYKNREEIDKKYQDLKD